MGTFQRETLTRKKLLKFIIPAAIGAFLYLCPFSYGGSSGIVIGVLLTTVSNACAGWSQQAATILMCVTAFATLLCMLTKPAYVTDRPRLCKVLIPGWTETIIRIVGAILAIVVMNQLFTEVIYSGDTGGTMLDLTANIMIWFIVASIFVPFLLDFGLMEFIGTLCRGIARPLLKIPGRSMIDVLTSFMGDQNLGIMLTNDQYIHGYYTAREAVIISTCFSATGIAYWYIISSILGVDHYFAAIIATMFITALVSTFIMVRIRPITGFSTEYYQGQKENLEGDKPEDMSTFQFAVQLAVRKADSFQGVKTMAARSMDFCSSVIFSVLPVVMIIGTLGLIVATYTPVFNWLGLPFRYYMELLQIPFAAEAAPAAVAGFADVMIPSLLAAEIASERTRFIVCVLSLIQIIYMSEVGPILMMSEIPVKLRHLIVLFIEKTIIALPIITLCAVIFGIPA